MGQKFSKQFDIISLGDTTVDVFLAIDEATVLCDINREHCRLCLNYADKIPVKNVTFVPGVGNAANNAVGSSRLGLKAALYTVIGDDQNGKDAFNNFRREKVALDFVRFDKGRGTNYSTVLNYQGERTILVFHEKRRYSLPKFPKTKWLYYTSLGLGFEEIHSSLVRYVRSSGARLAFNPGSHQLRVPLRKIQPILRAVTLLILNKEEGQKLVGETNDLKELMSRLQRLGPEIIVVTDGQRGAYAFDGQSYYYLSIFDSLVVERTGCGDAFSTGFIAALIYGQTVPVAMRWGSFNSVGVLQEIGAQKGLLSKKQMELFLKRNPNYKAKEI